MASFFISYTTSDEAWARWVDKILNEAGHDTFAMFADIPPGKHFVVEMHRALQEDRIVLLLLSPRALSSDGMLQEWSNALARDLGSRRRNVIPVRIADCQPDGLLSGLVYVDLVGIDQDKAKAELLKGVDLTYDPRCEPAEFPGGARAAETPKNHNWPNIISPLALPERRVVGRDQDTAELRNKLTDDAALSGPGRVVIKGQGGMGKSTLAQFYVQQFHKEYFGIWWILADRREHVIADLAKLAGPLSLDDQDATPEVLATAVIQHLQRTEDPWLLVYDNATAPVELKGLRPRTGQCHCLVTCRTGRWRGFTQHRTDSLPEKEATELLLQECERENEDPESTRALVKVLDGLPLALVCAGAWLRDAPGTSFKGYMDRHEALLSHKPETVEDYPDSVFAATKLSLDELSWQTSLILKLSAFLAPYELRPDMFCALAEESDMDECYDDLPSEVWALVRDKALVEQAFAELNRVSLLEPAETLGSWKVHRLTQAVQRALLGPSWETYRDAATAILCASYPKLSQYRSEWATCALRAPHVATILAFEGETAAMDHLLERASGYLDAMRLDDQALHYVQESLRMRQNRLGDEDETVGSSFSVLAIQLWRLERFEEAEKAAARAVHIAKITSAHPLRRSSWLGVHGITAVGLAQSAKADARTEWLKLAARRHQEALGLDRLHNRRNKRVIATRLHNLGEVRALQGRWGAALRLYGAALRIDRTNSDLQDDPDLAASLYALGTTLLEAGRAHEGYRSQATLDLLCDAMDMQERVFERDTHPDRVRSAKALACAHWALPEVAPNVTGRVEPDREQFAKICKTYDLKQPALLKTARDYVARAQLYTNGKPVPPMPPE